MLPSVVHLYVLLFFMTKIMHCQSLCSCDIPDSDFASGIYLTYYKCNNETPDTIAYPITAPNDLLDVLEDKRTIFYVFGYLQFPENPNVQLMMKALCYERTDNIVLLDWSKYSNGTYPIVFQRAEKVGSLFAQSIRLLVEKGLNISKIYIVAHSLGTHIAGFAGKCNSFKVPRITALDPANPIIYPIGCYLKSDDAMWIDVIHTDMGGYGIPWTMGTADYVVNHGIRPQPGCELVGLPLSPTDVCSHQTSVEIYAESKYNSSTFDVKKCSFVQYIFFTDCTEPIGIGYTAANISGTVYVSYVPINSKYWAAISPYSTYY
ncbi:PREDICTED: lipase member H-like [Vollenhovia emeryi]|uniref:lipase member H-like n=1 Tax=Vollenhovia emeryi TaxID=411798 RepID=UPI0005F57ED1|nr:PREDICTED: lipase member H-like [Vollenhovia emeryi]